MNNSMQVHKIQKKGMMSSAGEDKDEWLKIAARQAEWQ